jgi:hypothetical protein
MRSSGRSRSRRRSRRRQKPDNRRSRVGRPSLTNARQSFATVTGLTCCTLATRPVARRSNSNPQRWTLNFPPRSCFGLMLFGTQRPDPHSDRADRDRKTPLSAVLELNEPISLLRIEPLHPAARQIGACKIDGIPQQPRGEFQRLSWNEAAATATGIDRSELRKVQCRRAKTTVGNGSRALPSMESHTASHRRSWGALHARECEQTYRVRLGEFRQGNATHGHAGEVEAILSRAQPPPSMTS